MVRLGFVLWLLWTSAVVCDLPALPQTDPPRRPNVLFALADDWGWPHAGALGDRVVATPTFDRLAKEGVLFDHAWVASPSCTPSRNAILTGQHVWRLGEGANLHSTLDVAQPTFVALLREAGYEVGHWRKAWGPGDWRAGGYTSDPCGPESSFEDFLARRDADKPFCFWFGTSDPHRPYERGSGRRGGILPEQIELPACWPDRAEVREDVADYYLEVQRWDREVGAALVLLERRGLLDDTLVVMTGDHGMPFPRGKGNLYDLGSRVPLAVRWGKVASPGRTVPSLVSLTDLAPTFLAAAGCEVPPVMTGRSLLPQLTTPQQSSTDAEENAEAAAEQVVVFGRERHTPAQEKPSLDGYPSRALRTRRWLLILNFEPDRWPAGVPDGATHPIGRFADCDDGPTKQLLAAGRDVVELAPYYALCFAKRPPVELYDCDADRWQVHNLADDPAHAATVAELRAQLLARLAATGDPRAGGERAPFDAYPYRAGYLQKSSPRQGR